MKKPAKPWAVAGFCMFRNLPESYLVLRAGLEPARLSALPPQDSASTNSAT